MIIMSGFWHVLSSSICLRKLFRTGNIERASHLNQNVSKIDEGLKGMVSRYLYEYVDGF